jgi:flagellar hook-associated protein 3 FlgL
LPGNGNRRAPDDGSISLKATMRITNSIIQQTSLTNVERNLREIYRAQDRVTSGLRIRKASDDPVGAATAMQTRGSLRALEQYRRGAQTATARASAEETVLDELSKILIRAKELGVVFGSDTTTEDQRAMGSIEVEELMKQVVSMGNTRFQDGYLFGGTDSAVRPYEAVQNALGWDFTTTSPTGTQQVEVSASHTVPTNHNGTEVFEDTGVLVALRDMAQALKSGDGERIRDSLEDVNGSFDLVQNLIGDIGARMSSLQVTSANLDAVEVNLQILKSDVEEADLEKSITELISRQTSYQAALMTTSRVMGLNLADYLR